MSHPQNSRRAKGKGTRHTRGAARKGASAVARIERLLKQAKEAK